MERFFPKRKIDDVVIQEPQPISQASPSVRQRVEVNLDELPIDPAKRKSIYDFDANDRETIRRFYLQKGPFQPKMSFPWRQFGDRKRRFVSSWFNDHPSWLEYSVSTDSSYCLYCYLFKPLHGGQSGGEVFITKGFTNWKEAMKKFKDHVGDINSVHNKCMKACQDLMQEKQHIEVALSNQSEQTRVDYRTRLIASIDVARLCLSQALAFRGHDESEDSTKKGNFVTFLQFLADNNEEIKKVVLDKAPENNQLTSPRIQKDIVRAMALETTKIILGELGDDLFSILVDESRDISIKEQMVVLLRYVDKHGCIVERFLGVVHVSDTTSLSLKAGIEELLGKHNLSITNIRGQGYDGASNMQGKFNGLKSLILKENPCAFYVHCFAHQLQLALIGGVKKDRKISMFFTQISTITNVVVGSCKRQDLLRDKQTEEIVEGLCSGEIISGKGLNQESTLKRAGDTRWGSHYSSLLSLIRLFNPVICVLEHIVQHTDDHGLRGNAELMLLTMNNFDFVFFLHLMKNILGISDGLSRSLQRKGQDIINAMKLVNVTKTMLKTMRRDGWEDFIKEVTLFCEKHEINVVDMNASFADPRRVLRNKEVLTNYHVYHNDKFVDILEKQVEELNDRFSEIGTDLLLGMSCLDPKNSFCAFDKEKLINYAKFYPAEFSPTHIMELEWALPVYFEDVRHDDRFSTLNGIAGLGKKMVETGKHLNHPLVYLLIKLAMLLPVATAGVERSFSSMNIIKTRLRNRIGDEWLNDILVTYVERDIFLTVKTEDVIQRFQNMKSRRIAL